jgi:hypothetical protein
LTGTNLTTTVNGVTSIVDLATLQIEPWQKELSTNKATLNTDNIYQMGNVGIGTNNRLAGVTLDVRGAVRLGNPPNPVPAVGTSSFVAGFESAASGDYAISMGRYTKADGYNSFAAGNSAESPGNYSVAIGNFAKSSGTSSLALSSGGAEAQGDNSTALGVGTVAPAANSTTLGKYNAIITANATSVIATDPLFQIGSGTSSVKNNAMTILNNGNTGIGLNSTTGHSPAERFDVGTGNVRVRDINTVTGTASDNVVVADATGILKTITSASLIPATSNALTATNGNLVSTVNGVSSTPAVPLLTSADNGLTATNGKVQLDGALTKPTTITTTAANTLTFAGLQAGAATDNIVMADASTGALKIMSPSLLNDWHITGNIGTNPAINFLGTTDNQPLMFRINNIFAGTLSLNNTSIGYRSWNSTTAPTGTANVALGTNLFSALTTGSQNIAIGNNALSALTVGSQNIAIGNNALASFVGNSGGASNIAIGNSAANKMDNTYGNIAIGDYALQTNTQAAYSVAIGYNALNKNIAQGNVAIGGLALVNNNGGQAEYNVGIGFQALTANTTAGYNVGIGWHSQFVNTTGYDNVGLGPLSLGGNTIGFGNTGVGANAAAYVSSGNFNTSLGHFANLTTTTGSYNIVIGALQTALKTNATSITANNGLAVSSASASNEMNIGNTIIGVGVNNPLTNQALGSGGKIGINTGLGAYPANPNGVSATLDVNGDTRIRNLPAGATTDNLVTADANGYLKTIATSALAVEPWQIQGTTNKATNNNDAIYQMGKVGIGTSDMLGGTTNASTLLAVNGSIETAFNLYSDYVFEKYFNKVSPLNDNYTFKSLKEVEVFINENKHLPGVTSIKELSKNERGEYIFNISELSVQVLEKVEELYLHTIEQQKSIDAKDKEIRNLKETVSDMDLRIVRLEKLLENQSNKK